MDTMLLSLGLATFAMVLALSAYAINRLTGGKGMNDQWDSGP